MCNTMKTEERRLKIFLIATCPYYYVRGKPLRVHSHLLAFQSLGHRITVMTYANGSRVDLPNVKIFRAPQRFRMRNPQKIGPGLAKVCSDWAMFIKASRILRKERHDIIVGTDIEGAVIASRLKKQFGLPVIVDIHGIFSELLQNNTPWVNHLLGPLPSWVEKRLWRKADMLVCNWPRVEQYAKRVAPNIPSCTVFDVPRSSVHEVAEKPYPVSNIGRKLTQQLQGKKVILYAGNFAPYQNFSLALRGFKHALEKGLLDSVLLIVGEGYDTYLQVSKELGIENDVLFVAKRTPEECIDLMQLADVCLTLISSGGNAPSKVIYYFLAGSPILACDSLAHRELLKDGDNALFCKNSPVDFAEKLIYLLENEDIQVRLRRSSSRCGSTFSLSSFKTKWDEILGLFSLPEHTT